MTEENPQTIEIQGKKYQIVYLPLSELKHPVDYENPRKHTDEQFAQLERSIKEFGMPQPLIVNSAEGRKGVIIGGNFRYDVLKKLGHLEAPIIFLDISDIEREKELNLRLNKNTGDWDEELLAKYFTEEKLGSYGWVSEELDNIFPPEEHPEVFDLQKELGKLNISQVTMQTGDLWTLGNSRLMIGDSTKEEDVLKLMGNEKADMCFTDEPYLLDYNNGKRHGNPTEGFGYKRDRKYLGTDVLPDDFVAKWMANVHKIQKEHFSIIAFENWKNLRLLWNEMEKYWKVVNLLIWHTPNRHQGFSRPYRFFSKHDIALAAATPGVDIEFNNEDEETGLQQEFESALFAISGHPHWEGYEKGKKIQPTDHMTFRTSDEKNSGQGVVFGTKPMEILIPYIKVLTKRNDLIYEPFGGSGSTLIAAEKLKRRCYIMELVPAYAEVIRARWERLTGQKAVKISG